MAKFTAGAFEKALADGFAKNKFGENTINSAKWLRNKAASFAKTVGPRDIIRDEKRSGGPIMPGSMFFMHYDPKTKAKLPYYDRYPLIIIVDFAPNGFYGLNVHYLPLKERAILLDNLFAFLTNTRFDHNTRIKMSYALLKEASNLRGFKPCFKRYLYSHIKEGPVFIHPVEWNLILFVPLERFVKASTMKVYADSRKIMNGLG